MLVTLLPMMGWGYSFRHYTGFAGDGTFNGNGTQKCHEQVYYYYVTQGQTINLDLPFVNYTYSGSDWTQQGQNAEPRAWFRWYNWEQDGVRNGYGRLSIRGRQLLSFDDGAGYFYCYMGNNRLANAKGGDCKGPYRDNIGVTFQAPSSDADYAAWTSDTIACDVSRYTEYKLNGNTLREPTLSIRYKFVIRKAEWLADQLREAVVNPTTYTRTFEDGKYITVGINGTGAGQSEAIFRLNYPDISRYFFYPLSASAWNKKNIFYDENDAAEKAKNDFTKDDFENTLLQANGCIWLVYDDTYRYYCTVPSETGKPFFCKISPYILNNHTWSRVADRTEVGKPGADKDGALKTFNSNSRFYIVAYLAYGTGSDGKYCPVANFTCRYVTDYPRLFGNLETDAPMRTLDYIGKHFASVTDPISFDNSSADMTLDLPTAANNMAQKPSKWDLRHYGFIYRDLKPYLCIDGLEGLDARKACTPLHGEYGLFKTAGVAGVSKGTIDNSSDYDWFFQRSNTNLNFYDRTYALTGGTQSGYFFYVDASDESRPIASANFNAKLCTGSTLVVSAAVADLTALEKDMIKPQLVFKLYGIDDDGQVKQENLIHSFATGDFRTIGASEYGKWYQVYAKVILRKGANVERFSKFKVTIDNYCPGTNGADYAIDDIRLYKEDAIVNVIQQKPLCEDASEAAGAMNLKLRASYTSLSAKLSDVAANAKGEKAIYYRIIDEDGKPLNIHYGNGDKKYGETTFHDKIADCTEGQIEHVVNEDYFVIANQAFDLEANKNYYVVLAFENPDDENSWGHPQNVCSVYSQKFSLVKQGIVIRDNNSKVMASYRVGCDKDNANISIKAELQTTDQVLGGSVGIPSVPFDWFFGSKEEFLQTKLLQALQAFRAVKYDNKVSYTATVDKFVNEGKLSKEYGEEIKKYMNNGKLVLAFSSTCPSHTYALGKNSITVLPVVTGNNEITVAGYTYTICPDPMEYTFSIYKGGPKINLGFCHVTYPSNDGRVLRLGLPQLKDMGNSGCIYLPINGTKKIDAAKEGSPKLEFNVTGYVRNVILSGSNDPMVQDLIGKQVYFNIEESELLHQDVETSQRYIRLKLPARMEIDKLFHEGYSYDLTFEYTQQSTSSQYVSCPGSTEFTIKVVPEYATWKPSADGGNNNNWNNDLNWCRSSRQDLYKGEDYPVYGETDGYQELSTQQAFVPMKFTKVTLLGPQYTIGYYPTMGYLQRGADGLLNMLTNGSSTATDDIQYDLMLDDSPSSMPSDVEADEGNYGCVPFYGNTCDQIYFKPEAELRNQQYLIYNKVWVEKELNLRQRYLLGSPLRETYSRDMYVPKANGKQQTEAFEDIHYDASLNNRSTMPFYQRGWDDSSADEVTKDDATKWKAYDYSGDASSIQMPSEITWTVLQWTHPYNDVAVKYSPTIQADGSYTDMRGFSLQVGDKYTPDAATVTDGKALLRLPKADTEYAYTDGSKRGVGQTVVRTEETTS